MITQLTLDNYRNFRDEVTVRFRPITLLLGLNGTGKSTILHFLATWQDMCNGVGSHENVAESFHSAKYHIAVDPADNNLFLRLLTSARYMGNSKCSIDENINDFIGAHGEYACSHLSELFETKDSDTRYDTIVSYLNKFFQSTELFDTETFGKKDWSMHSALAKDAYDVAYSIQYILPVLLQGVLCKHGRHFFVQNPESGLHPSAALDMGSFFVDIWKNYGVGSVIETHSRNIMLRIRRLISRGDLCPEDVSVAYLTKSMDTGKVSVKNLDIDSDGALSPGLPMEFFGADVIEGLELGARK